MRVATFAVLTAALLAVGQQQMAEASHIISTDITINGTPVASGNAFTDPLINVEAGEDVIFSFDLYGNSDPTFNVNFIKNGGTLATPANATTAYPGGFTQANPFVFTFTRTFATAGTFDGGFISDLDGGPTYRFPGGNGLTDPFIPFRLNVTPASDPVVPEPTSMALLGTGLAGLFGYGWRRRKPLPRDTIVC